MPIPIILKHINKLVKGTNLLRHLNDIELIELDSNNYFIKVTSVFDVFESFGTKSINVNLYYFGEQIFSFNTYDKGEVDGNNYLNQTDFKIDKINNEILLTVSGSKYDYKLKKVVVANEIKKYTFWFSNKFGLSKVEKK